MLWHGPDPQWILVRGAWVTVVDPETGRPHEVFGAESEIIRVEAAAARAWYAELKRYGLKWSDPEDRE
jgi:hypothetical protein